MGFFSKIFDDVLGLDPGGGGIYGVARDVLGDKIADDVLGMDPSGGGFIKEYNVLLPMIAGYYGLEALGGTEGIANMFGSGSGAAGTTFTEAQLAAASASADPIAYLASATPGAAVGAGEALAAGTLSGGGGAAGGAGAAGAGTYSGSIMNSLKTLQPYASIGSSLAQGYSTNKAAQGAANAANAGAQSQIDLQRRMYEEGVARQQPFYQAGVNALPGYLSGIGQGGELVRGFTMADYQADPGYAFRLSEGQKQLDRQAAIRGGQISGPSMKAAARYGQEMGSQEYSNAYNRFRDTQSLRRNALAGVTGFAPTAANAMGSLGQNYATSAGSAMANQGVNTGNALIAGQQARQSMYGDIGSTLGKYLGSSNSLGRSSGSFNADPNAYAFGSQSWE
jgi:hypothetical protein